MRIDTCGTSCPQPVLMTKKALSGNTGADKIEVLTDNNTSKTNVKKYLLSNGFNVEIEEADDLFIVRGIK
ncbi:MULTISPECIES: sulfurtransferase TusA family protein [unclassified Sedimentibacter]|uniref:sulfurtransferase TusA family protein n=1 Tax=unclassified Sedimentibacter TaxID=2649220 RepID=UPI0027E0C3BC|nr:sulfurtransferase TusA family protein [Sedimentibacter sp. MB35-C1]WMJ78907.1 sulfurtransferase TusA family protein [Sedimentibacter sp. MB35-C1]